MINWSSKAGFKEELAQGSGTDMPGPVFWRQFWLYGAAELTLHISQEMELYSQSVRHQGSGGFIMLKKVGKAETGERARSSHCRNRGSLMCLGLGGNINDFYEN